MYATSHWIWVHQRLGSEEYFIDIDDLEGTLQLEFDYDL